METIRRLLQLVILLGLLLWAVYLYSFMFGLVKHDWFQLGPIGAPLFIFGFPIGAALVFGVLNRLQKR